MSRFLKEPFPSEIALIKVAEQHNLKAGVTSHPDRVHVCSDSLLLYTSNKGTAVLLEGENTDCECEFKLMINKIRMGPNIYLICYFNT